MTRCAKCGKALAKQETVYASEGQLYCSWKCAGNDDAEEVASTDVLKDDIKKLWPLTDGRKKIAEIISRRDKVTIEEAYDQIIECLQGMEACNYANEESEDLMSSVLGLEPDYVFDLLL